MKTDLRNEIFGRKKKTNPLGLSKSFAYDAAGNITEVTDEAGNVSQYRYSPLGDLIEAVDATGHSVKYGYDKCRRLTKMEQVRVIDDTLAGLPELQITTYERNRRGDVTAVRSPLGTAVEYRYDALGRVSAKTDEDGLETLYEYNLAGKLAKVGYADGREVLMSYNGLRQLEEVRDWLGVTKLRPDAMGRITEATDFGGKTVRYGWDTAGRRERLTYPDGSEAKYVYDKSGRLISMESASGMVNYAYDAMGRIRERVMPEDVVTKYEADPLGRLTSLTHSKAGDVLDRFAYSYDPVGNITEIEKKRAGLETDSGLFRYAYDPVGRLISAAKGDRSKEYRYDSLGNRIAEAEGNNITRHEYNARNQILRTVEPDAEREYRYDERGNLTQLLENGEVTARYIFDATNRLAAAMTEKGRAEYAYNGFLQRVHKLENFQGEDLADPTRETRYLLDMTRPYNNLLATEGSENQSFLWGNELLSAEGDKSFRYLQDHLGSPVRLLGEGMDETLSYDEFGVPLHGQNRNNPFGFTGYQMDEVTGMYFAQARYYVPEGGRFAAEDPVKDQFNWYGYCGNDPIRFVDPMGLDAIYITQSDAVGGMGHSGAAVQDSNDDWYFYYWGNEVVLEPVKDPSAMDSKDNFNDYLDRNGLLGPGKLPYDETVYLEGDFTAAYDHYDELNRTQNADSGILSPKDPFYPGGPVTNLEYNLFTNNCTLTTMEGLYQGTLANGQTLGEYLKSLFIENSIIPNIMNSSLQDVLYNDAFTQVELYTDWLEKYSFLTNLDVNDWIITKYDLESLTSLVEGYCDD